MRIAVLSLDDSRGGAAKVAQILAHGLAGRGHDVQFLVRSKHLEGDASVALEWPARRGKSNDLMVYYRQHTQGHRVSRDSWHSTNWLKFYEWPAAILLDRVESTPEDRLLLATFIGRDMAKVAREGHFRTAMRGYALCRKLTGRYPGCETRWGVRLPHPIVWDVALRLRRMVTGTK